MCWEVLSNLFTKTEKATDYNTLFVKIFLLMHEYILICVYVQIGNKHNNFSERLSVSGNG